MDIIGGWEEEEGEQDNWWVRDVQRACGGIYTKAVVCNGQNHMQNFRIHELRSIVEAVNWLCDDALDEHVWVSEQAISLQEAKFLEALQRDLEIQCIVQCCMLWFFAPTSLNNDLLIDGEILGESIMRQSTWRSGMFLGHHILEKKTHQGSFS